MYQSRVHDVEELLDIWHGLQQSAVDSAIDGQRVFAAAYGPKEVMLSSDNMLIE